jgi:hypothetical protein
MASSKPTSDGVKEESSNQNSDGLKEEPSNPASDNLKEESSKPNSDGVKGESSNQSSDHLKQESSNQTSDNIKEESSRESSSVNPPGPSAAEVQAEASSDDSYISYTAEDVANNRFNITRDEAGTLIDQAFEQQYRDQMDDKYGIHVCGLCECEFSLMYKLYDVWDEPTWEVEKARQAFEDWDAEHSESGRCYGCGYDMVDRRFSVKDRERGTWVEDSETDDEDEKESGAEGEHVAETDGAEAGVPTGSDAEPKA